MIVSSMEIRHAIDEAFHNVKARRITKKMLYQIVDKVFLSVGIDIDEDMPRRVGVVNERNNNMMLICRESDGYKLIPLRPGMNLELAYNGSWHPVQVAENDKDTGLNQKLTGIDYDDVPVLGAWARMVLSLSPSGKKLQIEEAKKQIESKKSK